MGPKINDSLGHVDRDIPPLNLFMVVSRHCLHSLSSLSLLLHLPANGRHLLPDFPLLSRHPPPLLLLLPPQELFGFPPRLAGRQLRLLALSSQQVPLATPLTHLSEENFDNLECDAFNFRGVPIFIIYVVQM